MSNLWNNLWCRICWRTFESDRAGSVVGPEDCPKCSPPKSRVRKRRTRKRGKDKDGPWRPKKKIPTQTQKWIRFNGRLMRGDVKTVIPLIRTADKKSYFTVGWPRDSEGNEIPLRLAKKEQGSALSPARWVDSLGISWMWSRVKERWHPLQSRREKVH